MPVPRCPKPRSRRSYFGRLTLRSTQKRGEHVIIVSNTAILATSSCNTCFYLSQECFNFGRNRSRSHARLEGHGIGPGDAWASSSQQGEPTQRLVFVHRALNMSTFVRCQSSARKVYRAAQLIFTAGCFRFSMSSPGTVEELEASLRPRLRGSRRPTEAERRRGTGPLRNFWRSLESFRR